jgi:hypothetical protein
MFGAPTPYAETAFDALLPGGIFSSDFHGAQQSRFGPAPAPAPTPLTLSSPANAAGRGGIIHDQQPSSIASSSLSSSCSSTAPLRTMDTTTTAQSSDPATFHRTREHCFGALAQALELAEKSPYKPIVENTCKAAETLDKIAQVLNESGEFGLSRECIYYADACALAAHGFADSTQGALLGLNDAAHDCAYAAAHPIQTAQSYIKANLEFAKLIFELGKLCFDPALSGHRIETAQHMAAAFGQAIEEKFDHMQQASLQENAREIAHFLATAKAAGIAQNVAFQQLGKLTEYVARLKKVIEAEKPMAESLGVAPIIEKSLEKAGPKAAQQLGRAAEFEKKIFRLPPNERVAAIITEAESVAKAKGLEWDRLSSKINKRDVYVNRRTNTFYSVDTQHGRFEVLNKKGIHMGEVDFDLNPTKGPDLSGRHNLKMS